MTLRMIEVSTSEGHLDTVMALADGAAVIECHIFRHVDYDMAEDGETSDEPQYMIRLLTRSQGRQQLLDHLHRSLGTSEDWRVVVLPVEAALPFDREEAEAEKAAKSKGRAARGGKTREELYSDAIGGAKLDANFLILAFLSTLVAAIGLAESNVAVIIGAMVIAPLLGPNIALVLGTALGDGELIRRALATLISGVLFCAAVGVAIGLSGVVDLDSPELLSRTTVNLAGIGLALASGAAAALSLTAGLSSTLVGVMVAVALLPPTATVGIMLGVGNFELAAGAFMLLLVNIACVNVAAQLVFLWKGIRPHRWYERKSANQSTSLNLLVWAVLLIVLTVVIVSSH